MKTFRKVLSVCISMIFMCLTLFAECDELPANLDVSVKGEKITGGIIWQHYIDCTFSAEFLPKGTKKYRNKNKEKVKIDWESAYHADCVIENNFQKKSKYGYFVACGNISVAVVAGGTYKDEYNDYAQFHSNAAEALLKVLLDQLIDL